MSDTANNDVIVDRFGRRFDNLRVSLTAACNYACTYCVPNGKRLQAAAYELSAQEMIRAVTLLQQTTGISKVRITGGEPLLSPKFGLRSIAPATGAAMLAPCCICTCAREPARPPAISVYASLEPTRAMSRKRSIFGEGCVGDLAWSGIFEGMCMGMSLLQHSQGIRLR